MFTVKRLRNWRFERWQLVWANFTSLPIRHHNLQLRRMTFGAVLHKELLWDFSFSVLGYGIVTHNFEPRLSLFSSLFFESSRRGRKREREPEFHHNYRESRRFKITKESVCWTQNGNERSSQYQFISFQLNMTKITVKMDETRCLNMTKRSKRMR